MTQGNDVTYDAKKYPVYNIERSHGISGLSVVGIFFLIRIRANLFKKRYRVNVAPLAYQIFHLLATPTLPRLLAPREPTVITERVRRPCVM